MTFANSSKWYVIGEKLGNPQYKTIQEQVKKDLLDIPHLEDELKLGLFSKYNARALYIIENLQLTQFVPSLLDISHKYNDPRIYLTLNTFLQSKDKDIIKNEYIRRLQTNRLTNFSKKIVLKGLRNNGYSIPAQTLDTVYNGKDVKVKMDTVSFALHFMESNKNQSYIPFIERALVNAPMDVKKNILMYIAKAQNAKPWIESLKSCSKKELKESDYLCSTVLENIKTRSI
jgi:hypothetical protein